MRRLNTTSSPTRITFSKREEMFQVYQEGRSIQQVAALCSVNKKTAKKWCLRDNWDMRCDAIEAKMRKKMERKLVNRRLRNVRILDTAIEGIAEELENGLKLEPKMLARLIMTQDLLIGRGAADEETPSFSPEAKEALAKLQALGEDGLRMLADRLADAGNGNGDKLPRRQPVALLEDKYTVTKTGVVKRKPKGGFGTARKSKNL